MEPTKVKLTDVVREIAGWTIRLDRVQIILARADKLLPDGGRNCRRDLTPDEVTKLISAP